MLSMHSCNQTYMATVCSDCMIVLCSYYLVTSYPGLPHRLYLAAMETFLRGCEIRSGWEAWVRGYYLVVWDSQIDKWTCAPVDVYIHLYMPYYSISWSGRHPPGLRFSLEVVTTHTHTHTHTHMHTLSPPKGGPPPATAPPVSGPPLYQAAPQPSTAGTTTIITQPVSSVWGYAVLEEEKVELCHVTLFSSGVHTWPTCFHRTDNLLHSGCFIPQSHDCTVS